MSKKTHNYTVRFGNDSLPENTLRTIANALPKNEFADFVEGGSGNVFRVPRQEFVYSGPMDFEEFGQYLINLLKTMNLANVGIFITASRRRSWHKLNPLGSNESGFGDTVVPDVQPVVGSTNPINKEPKDYELAEQTQALAEYLKLPVRKSSYTLGASSGDVSIGIGEYWRPLRDLNDAAMILVNMGLNMNLDNKTVRVYDSATKRLIAEKKIANSSTGIAEMCVAIVCAGVFLKNERTAK